MDENKTLENIKYVYDYQLRNKEDLLKLFALTHWKYIRNLLKATIFSLLIFLIWNFTKIKLLWLVFLFCIIIILLMFLIGLLEWIDKNRIERKLNLSRAWVKERSLEYGNFGLIYSEISKNGLFQVTFGWKRFKYVVEWENFLFLFPANRRYAPFIFTKEELGISNFEELKHFAKGRLEYKRIRGYFKLIL